MPQVSQLARRDPVAAQRAIDKEAKRARGALSCAECRRLKLKCDKTVPCSSCKRRGCSAICPNGSLITGQGTRFVLADTEKLHTKISQMSDRIRQLEDALAILQSTQSSDPHPLLDRDSLRIKSSLDLHAAVGNDCPDAQEEEQEESQYIDAFGTLAIRDDGAATFYGRSAGSESLLIGEATSPTTNRLSTSHPLQSITDATFLKLSTAFPFSHSISPGLTLTNLASALPPYPEAWRLCGLYLDTAPWFFGPVTKRQVHEELLPLWYPQSASPPSSGGAGGLEGKGTAHELALLFVIFCFGALTDMALPPAPENPEAENYYQLTKAALALDPVLERPPSVSTVQALSLMGIYEGLCSGENSIESTWAMMGLATKLAQSIGLHRDCARWKLQPAEVQKRRALFWELFITDCWQSLATGRLATFSLPFVDCELPFDPDQTMAEDGTVQPSFPFWKARFGAECVSAVVQGTLTSRAPKYSIILELDRKVRDMEFPAYAQGAPPEGQGLAGTMSHFMPTNYRELTLLYIHRCFFAHAISSHPRDPIKSQYAPSFLAGYRSACTILGSVKQQFTLFPAQIARFWVLWTHAFSAAVMLASVVTHSSQSKVAPAALLELRTAYELFQTASTYGGRAVKFFPIIKRLQQKAHQVYIEANNGIPQNVPNDIFRPSTEEKDELEIFSGKTHTVTTKVPRPKENPAPPPSQGAQVQTYVQAQQHAALVSDHPSFAGVHPSLMEELHGFDGQIAARIRNAYTDGVGESMIVGLPDTERADNRPMNGNGSEELQGREEQQRMEMDRAARDMALVRREAMARQAHEQQQQEQQRRAHEQQQEQQRRAHEQQQEQEQQRQMQMQMQQEHYERQEQWRLREMEMKHLEQEQQLRQQAETHRQPQHFHQEQYQHQHELQYAAQPQYPSHGHSQYPRQPQQHHLRQSPQSGYPAESSQQPPPQAVGERQFPSRRVLSHSHSLSNLHHAHSQQQSQSYTQHPYHHLLHQDGHSQPPLQISPPSYEQSPVSTSNSNSDTTSTPAMSAVMTHFPDAHANTLYSGEHLSVPPPLSRRHDYDKAATYWPGANSIAQGHHQYTPEGALRGIAADDYSLQETWQSYMYKVGSPRHLFED